MDTARLSFRPNEVKEFYETYMPGAYAVALVSTPEMPGDSHPECHPLTVVCAGPYECKDSERPWESLWGWVVMDYYTKESIGDALVDAKCEVGRWYYMVISHRQRKDT